MLKLITYLVTITIIIINFSCSEKKQDNSGFDVKFETIKGDDCHNCFGKLVVTKGTLIDTIKGGQWGKSVDYQTGYANKTRSIS